MVSSKVDFIWVNSEKALDYFISNLRAYLPLALDTEADSLHHYRENVCLIQASHDGVHYLLDPLDSFALHYLWEPVSRQTWILHGADFDLRMLRRAGAIDPVEVFDTMLAAQLVGAKAFGYGALVEQFCGLTLDKKNQKADWSQRPLSRAMVEYAVQDTQYLETVANALALQLTELSRREWHRQSCQRVLQASRSQREDDPENDWRITGSATLEPTALSILKEVWNWREKEGESADTPVFKIMHNELLLDLSVWCAQHPKIPPQGAPCWPRRTSPARSERLCDVIERGRFAEPIARLPRTPRPVRIKDAEVRMERLRVLRDKLAADFKMDPTVIASKSILQEIARKPETAPAQLIQDNRWCPWQWDLLKEAVPTLV